MAIFLFRVVVVVFLCGDPPSHIGPMSRYRESHFLWLYLMRFELVLWCLVVSWIPSFDVSVWVTMKGKKRRWNLSERRAMMAHWARCLEFLINIWSPSLILYTFSLETVPAVLSNYDTYVSSSSYPDSSSPWRPSSITGKWNKNSFVSFGTRWKKIKSETKSKKKTRRVLMPSGRHEGWEEGTWQDFKIVD